MNDMEIKMGYSAVPKKQSMLYGKTAKDVENKSQKNQSVVQKKADVKESSSASKTGMEENMTESGEAYGAEVDFAVSGRSKEVASQIWVFYVLEQEENLKKTEKEAEKDEKTGKKTGKKEETPFQKQLREKLEEAKSLDTMFRRMRELNEQAKKNNKKKKKVNYSYQRVSAAISGAKTSTQASLALSSAASNVSSLKRKAASGQYEKKEIEVALAHAEKMVRVARKKVQNIKWEVQQKKRNQSKEDRKKQQNTTIYSIPKKAKAEQELFRLKEQLKSQEKSKKGKNRREEDMGLMSANMQYLQRKVELLKQSAPVVPVTSITGNVITSVSENAITSVSGSGIAGSQVTVTAENAQTGTETYV